MALVQIEYPANLTTQADFSAHGDLIEAGLWDKVNSPLLVQGGNIPQGAVLQIGSVIFHGTTATAITGTASDYVQVTDNGDGTASAAYIATLTGVTWSAQYNGYYDGSGRLYIFDEGKALAAGQIASVFGRYLMQQANGDVAVGRDLAVKRNETIGGTLGVTGATTLSSASVTGNATVGGSLAGNIIDVSGDLRNGTLNPPLRGGGRASGFYTESARDNTNYPIGSILAAQTTVSGRSRNDAVNVSFDGTFGFTLDLSPPQLSGTWRIRGFTGFDIGPIYLVQRTA